MRNKLTVFITLLAAILGAAALTACGSGGVGKSGGGGDTASDRIIKRYNDNITYSLSYTSEKECPGGNISDSKLHSSIDFEIGEIFYMAVDFTISSFDASGWDGSFNSSITISPSTAISAKLEEAKTGNFTEKEENGKTNITATYSIPENKEQERTYRITVQLKQKINHDLVTVELAFYGDNESGEQVVFAEEWIIVGATPSLDYKLDGYTYTVTGSSDTSLTVLIIAREFNNIPVTAISDEAFKGFTHLNIVIIPQSIAHIGRHAFAGCSRLTNIAISDSVTSIGDHAFENCSALINVSIPDKVIEISSNMFYGCSSLNNVEVHAGVTAIGDYAFADCNSLSNIIIPDGVTYIGVSAFDGTAYYADRNNWDNNVLYIGNHFIKASEDVVGGYSVHSGTRTIAGAAFRDCGGLTDITIPDCVVSIGSSAFFGCSGLASMTIPFVGAIKDGDYNNYFGYIFGSDSYYNQAQYIPASLKTVVITGGTFIYIYAFRDCSGLANITLPDSVTYIYDGAFFGCSGLTSITLPDGITNIMYDAFSGCSGLTAVTIPGAVSHIGESAFSGCSGLASVTFNNTFGWRVLIPMDILYLVSDELTNPTAAANLLVNTYCKYYWIRN